MVEEIKRYNIKNNFERSVCRTFRRNVPNLLLDISKEFKVYAFNDILQSNKDTEEQWLDNCSLQDHFLDYFEDNCTEDGDLEDYIDSNKYTILYKAPKLLEDNLRLMDKYIFKDKQTLKFIKDYKKVLSIFISCVEIKHGASNYFKQYKYSINNKFFNTADTVEEVAKCLKDLSTQLKNFYVA